MTDTPKRRRAMWSWVVFDLANVTFGISVVSLYFPLWVVDNAGGTDTNYAVASGSSMAAVFVLAPIVGALADSLPRRVPLLVTLTAACSVLTAVLGLGGLYPSLVVFAFANTFFQLGLLVYDALLPIVSTEATRGQVSGYSVAAGFAGSLLGIALGSLILAFDETAKPTIFRVTAVIILLGAVPCVRWLREPVRPYGQSASLRLLGEAVAELKATARATRQCPGVARFLLGRAIYTDATNTLLVFMSIYATKEIGLSDVETSLVLVAGILVGPIGALWSGGAVDRVGPRRSMQLMLLVWFGALIASALVPLLGMPREVFWIVAPLIGFGMGGTSTTERAYFVRLAPPHLLGRFLGLYALVGRFAAIISPLLWVLVADILGLGRPIAVLMLAGFVLIARHTLTAVDDTPRAWPDPLATSNTLPLAVPDQEAIPSG
jgi:UMF1 family MFS transporter